MKQRNKHFILLGLLLMSFFYQGYSQERITQFNGFGHLEYTLNNQNQVNSFFSIGEHDFFVNSKLSKRISYLGEYVIRYNGASATSFLPSIERTLVKFNVAKSHNIIVGKIHTPLNYWNDVYHHGRLFFPTVDRPFAFSYLIPLHTFGVQFQGQNLGKLNFGYDVVWGNGIAATDMFHKGTHTPVSVATHIKPKDNMRIGLSYYNEYLPTNVFGTHSGHSSNYSHHTGETYDGAVNYELTCFSFAYFGNKIELLNEFSHNRTKSDSLGYANNFSNYTYIGFPIKEVHTPYVLVDYINVDHNDLHTYQLNKYKIGLGYRHQFNYQLNLKIQAEYEAMGHTHSSVVPMDPILSLRMQLAYGF